MEELCFGYSSNCYASLLNDSLREIDKVTIKCDSSLELSKYFSNEIGSFNKNYINYINKAKENGNYGSFFIMNDNIGKNDIRVLYKKDAYKTDSKKVLNRDLKLLKNDSDRVSVIRKLYKKFDYFLMTESFKIDNRGYHTLSDAYRKNAFNKLYYNIRAQIKNKLNKDGSYSDKAYYYVRLLDTFFYNEGFDNNLSLARKVPENINSTHSSFEGNSYDDNLSLTLISLNHPDVNELNELDDFYIEEKDDDRTWTMH